MEYIVIILFVGSLLFVYFTERKREEAELKRFREFVIANKTENISDYVQSIPNDDKFDVVEEDELIDLDQLTPEELLDIKQKELK